MDSATKRAGPDTALPERASDPYCGTPLGVEAAWCPNGIDLPPVAAAGETPMRPMEL
jgi:hypothetical protein